MVFDESNNLSGICMALNLNVIIWTAPINKELKPSKACGHGLWGIFATDTCLGSKLNNIETKFTGVLPHCFVIVIIKQLIWHGVAVLSLFIHNRQ